jgi:alkylation response protein AidB-like acyl-CoA dehydrogenase
MVIGLPPVLNFGSPELKKKVIPEVLSGKKYIALAISEAFAGSDVAGLQCTATKSADGQYYIVNGTKKWITNGTFADYFSTGVRTDKGLSVLLIERGEGVETKPIKTSYSPAAGTAYITFDNVKVPVGNLLGKENKGLQVILSNFNVSSPSPRHFAFMQFCEAHLCVFFFSLARALDHVLWRDPCIPIYHGRVLQSK